MEPSAAREPEHDVSQGQDEEPAGNKVGIRFDNRDLELIDVLRGKQTRTEYCRHLVKRGLALELQRRVDEIERDIDAD